MLTDRRDYYTCPHCGAECYGPGARCPSCGKRPASAPRVRRVAYRVWAAADRRLVSPVLQRRLERILADAGVPPESAIEAMCADAETYIRENAREGGPT